MNIFWFRRDIRWEDNRGLYEALQSDDPVLCIFIFDPHILQKLHNKEDKRISIIYDKLLEINKEWKKYSSMLKIYYGYPLEIWKALISQFNINSVFFNHDYEPYPLKRDMAVRKLLNANGINVHSFKDHVIFENTEIRKDNNMPYTIYTPFKKKWRQQVLKTDFRHYPSEKILYRLWRNNESDKYLNLKDIGFSYNHNYDISKPDLNTILTNYTKNRDYPSECGTSNLSVYLRFGFISIRKLMRDYFKQSEKFIDELIWREFYYMIMCCFPESMNHCFRKEYEYMEWENNEEDFDCWTQGKTGIPMVDAGMRELRTTGKMHNRVRMITASFLVKNLLIDWKWGERYFASWLLDFELFSNVGNWQWVAGTGCDSSPYFRIFNPFLQQDKFDRDKIYIRKWIPEIDTHDYPKPIVDLDMAKKRCLERYGRVRDRNTAR